MNPTSAHQGLALPLPLQLVGVSLLFAAVGAQSPTTSPRVGAQVPGSYIVQFTDPVDRSALRAAHRHGDALAVERAVRFLEQAVEQRRADFVRRAQALGGRVEQLWWIIDGARVDGLTPAILATLPGVVAVTPNRIQQPHTATPAAATPAPLSEYTNAQHHNSDAANQLRDASGTLVRGTGIGVAILDTGTTVGHRGHFPGGNTSNRTGPGLNGSQVLAVYGASGFGTVDVNAHGTHVAGDACANRAPDDGPAPAAGVVGIKVDDNTGSANDSWLITAWQLVAQHKTRHGIQVANNSYTGSPLITDPVQQALDETAWVADVAITCSAGNSGSTTTFSQSTYNGLAVGSVDKNTLNRSWFSATGPLNGTSRFYPHIVGGGNGVRSMHPNGGTATNSGTSMAAPMVAGILALVQQAGRARAPNSFDANAARAVVLNTTNPSSSRNTLGLGFAIADRAVDAAHRGDFKVDRLTKSQRVWRDAFVTRSGSMSITATWMKPGGRAQPIDLHLRVFDDNNQLVAEDTATGNSVEQVRFTPAATGRTYRLELEWRNPANNATAVDFALAGIGAGSTFPPPSISTASPAGFRNSESPLITLRGQHFERVQAVTIGGKPALNFQVTNAGQITCTADRPDIGQNAIVVRTTTGPSNPLVINVVGTHPAQLDAPPSGVRGSPTPLRIVGDRGWRSIYLVSTSSAPSAIPGIVSLGIGANFTQLWELATLTNDASGRAQLDLLVPTTVPQFTRIHFQVLTFDPQRPLPPFEVSNAAATTYF